MEGVIVRREYYDHPPSEDEISEESDDLILRLDEEDEISELSDDVLLPLDESEASYDGGDHNVDRESDWQDSEV